jgi:diguanylate cyclase (GGDEF)-like protein
MLSPSSASFAKVALIVAGALTLSVAFAYLRLADLGLGYIAILVFAAAGAPRLSIALPRSRFAISFADASVFLAFLLYGGPAAVVTAFVETLANCWYLRSRGYKFGPLMVPVNASMNGVSAGLTFWIYTAIPDAWLGTAVVGSSQHLIVTLGILGLVHFLISSTLAAVFFSIKEGSNVLATWRRDCFSSSMTQIVGAGLAGMVYKLVHFGDVLTGAIASVVIVLAYLSYRHSIDEVRDAINVAEAAERERAEAERERRREAEDHAEQLALSLAAEERANAALRQSEKDLQHAALYDSLTGLPNRKHFTDHLRSLIQRYKVDPRTAFQVLFIDIRKFKHINDSLGHTLGDQVLQIAAKRFVRMLNSDDLVARLGGDEFAVILRDLDSPAKAQKVARRIYDSIARNFSLRGNNISITVNIGVAPCDAEYDAPEEIVRDADIAMHFAKEKNCGVAVFTKDLRERFLERVRYENDLRHAIDRGELSMNYQPIVSLSDGELIGFEALLRWHHTEFGNIPPNKFVPIAEESGLILPITSWILQQTTTQLRRWQELSPRFADLIVSVNISGKHLSTDDLIIDVEQALAVSRVAATSLKLEITESAAMENPDHTIGMLNRLKELGVQLSIDDFGTGYSSLSYLHRLPFDTLKIDRSFVYSVGEKGENSEILQTIISLAKNLSKKVVAEGIETEAQLALLQNLGCDYGQGYLLARPQTRENMEKNLYERRNWLPRVTDAMVAKPTTTEQQISVH